MGDKPVCMVTGATSGIGTSTALSMAEHGYEVVMLGRSEEKLLSCSRMISDRTGNLDVSFLCGDLASLNDVRRIAEEFLASGKPLHRFISNAGITNAKRQTSAEGFEEMFAVNHLAPFLLTNLLLERINSSKDARIVVVASGAHAFCKGINFDDVNFESGFSSMKVYGHSKLANILFVHELAKRLSSTSTTANSCHPGAVATGLGTNNGLFGKVLMGALKPFFRTPEQGAETSLYLASSHDVGDSSGGYYYNCKMKTPKEWARDDEAAAKLWKLSEEMVAI
ncbi:MAG: SDR family oxidoreductase [Pseudomonadales bacterium]